MSLKCSLHRAQIGCHGFLVLMTRLNAGSRTLPKTFEKDFPEEKDPPIYAR